MSHTNNVGWVSDPNGRGTAGLITSCVLTLGLCAWSALHLNIPPKREPRRRYWSRNVRWVLLGVFIPELVVLAAWRQWASCRELGMELHHVLKAETDMEKTRDHILPKPESRTSLQLKVCEQRLVNSSLGQSNEREQRS